MLVGAGVGTYYLAYYKPNVGDSAVNRSRQPEDQPVEEFRQPVEEFRRGISVLKAQ